MDDKLGPRCANCGIKRLIKASQIESGFCSTACKDNFERSGSKAEREAEKLFEQYKRGGVRDPLF